MRARGGTRTAFQPLQTLGSRGNMRDQARSGRCTTQSEAQFVDSVHTPKFAFLHNAPDFISAGARGIAIGSAVEELSRLGTTATSPTA